MSNTYWYLEPRNEETHRCVSGYLDVDDSMYNNFVVGERPVKVIEVTDHSLITFLKDSRKTNPNLKFIIYRRRGNGPLEEVRLRIGCRNPLRGRKSVA